MTLAWAPAMMRPVSFVRLLGCLALAGCADGGQLRDPCSDEDGCTGTLAASAPGALGDPCNTASECASGFCASGICCQSACSPSACASFQCVNLDDDLRGVCLGTAFPDGTACNDGSACTTADACLAGACVGSRPGRGTDNFCSASCPCGMGDGDCDSAAQCQSGLNCVAHVGASFGMSASTDVCVDWDPT
jgi:hypothetical protein